MTQCIDVEPHCLRTVGAAFRGAVADMIDVYIDLIRRSDPARPLLQQWLAQQPTERPFLLGRIWEAIEAAEELTDCAQSRARRV